MGEICLWGNATDLSLDLFQAAPLQALYAWAAEVVDVITYYKQDFIFPLMATTAIPGHLHIRDTEEYLKYRMIRIDSPSEKLNSDYRGRCSRSWK